MALATLLACTEEDALVQWAEDEQVAEARPVSLRITYQMGEPAPQLRWREETFGLLIALVETGLPDLSDVTCHVGAAPPPRFLDPSRLEARLSLELDGGQDTFVLLATLCQPNGECRDLRASGLRSEPFDPMARLLSQIAALLGRRAPRGPIEERLRGSLSKNEYARLLAGRSAAVLYGLLPAPPPGSVGDKKKDPIARAVFLDPEQALAQWIAGRRDFTIGRRDSAVSALELAQRLQPNRIQFGYDLALALEGGDWRRAEPLFAQLARMAPTDHRFTASRAHALIALGRFDEAQQVLSTLPERYAKVPEILQMQVDMLQAKGDTGERFEALLAAWQDAAADRPEPVRRRVAWLVERGEFVRARALAGELAKRGATEESVRLEMSLALAAGDYSAARSSARALGLAEVEARIGARERLVRGDDPSDAVLVAKDRNGRLVRAELLLRKGRLFEALSEAQALIRIAPHDAEALALRVRALQLAPHLGDLIDAQSVLYYADPESARRLKIPRPARRIFRPRPAVHTATITATSTAAS